MSNKLKKALAIGAILLFGVVNLSNLNKDDIKNVVHVEKYKVRAGDTFWTISQRYYDLDDRNLYILEYMDELRELNPHLQDNHFQLHPNDFVNVKYITRD